MKINMAKKKWYVREEQPTTKVWEYVVEAETADEAEQLVRNGEVEPYDFTMNDPYDSPIDIIQIREVNDED